MIWETLLALSLAQPAAAPAQPKPAPITQPAPVAEAPAKPQPSTPAAAPAAKSPAKPAPTAPAARPAMTAEVKDLIDRMQAFYEKTQDFRSPFTQEYRYARMKRTQKSSGTVTYLKPGLMRFEYEQPAKKTFVLAGDKVYAYDPAAMQLTRGKIDTSQLSASVTFLFGQGKLADEFSIKKIACKDCSGTLLELTPLTQDPRFRKVLLEVEPATAQVSRSTVIDPDGSENTIRFVKLETNTGVNKDFFVLNPAPGTEVIDLTKMGQPQQK